MTPKLLNILLLISSAVLYFMVIDPLYNGTGSMFIDQNESIGKLTERVDTYDKTIAAVPALFTKAKKDTELFEAIPEDDRKRIMTMVPTSIEDIKLMSELTNIGIASGVLIDNMGIKDKGKGVYSVSFSVNTTYTNFKKIIKYWEESMRLFTLQSVTFAPGKTPDEPIKFNIELQTYYMN